MGGGAGSSTHALPRYTTLVSNEAAAAVTVAANLAAVSPTARIARRQGHATTLRILAASHAVWASASPRVDSEILASEALPPEALESCAVDCGMLPACAWLPERPPLPDPACASDAPPAM
jgi:hypothetical protein